MMTLRYLKNVVTLELDDTLCDGCTRCVQVCPHGVLVMRQKKAVIVDRDACMECGACALNCQSSALSVDSGVGCASAIIMSAASGRDEPCCDC